MLSSTKKSWFTSGVRLANLIPLIILLFWALISNFERTFAQSTNKFGDKGSPYLRPLEGLKLLLGAPLIMIENETNDIQFQTILIHFRENPIETITSLRNVHSIQLYAFAISSFRPI
ncbi:Putative ovule protein [Arachis hypogaea]|nr:Putative ovule protein [Arachis hypogaea]